MRAGASWDLRLLGQPTLRSNEGRVVELPKKAFVIAARLLLDRTNHRCSRSDLGEFLWPDADSSRQRTNLRTLLKRIRAGMARAATPPFAIEGEIVALNVAAMRCDLTEFRRLLAADGASDIVAAAALLSGELLEGCDKGSAAFEHWLRNQRSLLSQAFRRAACRALESSDLDLLPRKREALARRLIEENPNEEAGYLALLRIYASQGDFDRVRSTYDRLARNLKTELGCQPSDETRALYRSLVKQTDDATGASISQKREFKTVASPSPATAAAADLNYPVLIVPSAPVTDGGVAVAASAGVVDDLLVQLWKPRTLRIAVAGRDDCPVATGQNLIDANVYSLHVGLRNAETMRLSARLVHETASDLLWAESFSLTAERYDQVIARVADAIIFKIEDHQIEGAMLLPENQRTGFALVAQAERALTNVDLPSVRRARRLLRAAAQNSSNPSRAQARLARTFWMEWMLRAGQDKTLLTTARSIARSALETQPDNHIVHQELGMTALYQGQYQLALEHLSRARDLNPFDNQLLFDFADALIATGQAREALALVKAGKLTDYRLADFRNWVAATGHYVLGEYDDAIAELAQMKHPVPTYRLLAACYAMLGERERATEFKAKYLEENPNFSTSDWLAQCPIREDIDVKHIREGCLLAGFR
jgi:DNA-binding SARP family transcriptional activator